MRLWTIQPEVVWNTLQRDGVFHTDIRQVELDWINPYVWISKKMSKIVEKPPPGVFFPVWAWYQYCGENKKKPDLRYKGHLLPGERGVRIEFEAEDKKTLLSNFDSWHYVLNGWYLPRSKKYDSDISKTPGKINMQEIIEKSWDRVFNLSTKSSYVAGNRGKISIQATVWEIRKEQVKKVDRFISR